MRLKITLDGTNKFVPYEYHGFLQGLIYHALDEETGNFFHNEGFNSIGRTYRLFVFSELQGKYEHNKNGLIFLGNISFYISSVSSQLLNQLYAYFNTKNSIQLGKEIFNIVEAIPVDEIEYHDNNLYTIRTISPIIAYKTDSKNYKTYFRPKSEDFETSLRDNLKRKYITIFGKEPDNEYFEIIKIYREKQTKVKFKKSIYPSNILTMEIKVSNEYLSLLMHTGLGSKNASGFGMIEILNRNNNC